MSNMGLMSNSRPIPTPNLLPNVAVRVFDARALVIVPSYSRPSRRTLISVRPTRRGLLSIWSGIKAAG